jgi:uncharacterized protein (TIGR00369 family)
MQYHMDIQQANLMSKQWTNLDVTAQATDPSGVFAQLCAAFNQSPFLSHNQIEMRLNQQQRIEAYLSMHPHLLGNTAYAILHGGITASVLDSVGGINAMAALYLQGNAQLMEQINRKITRLATLDLRIDYVAPGRGCFFIAQAECIRLGNKSCLMRMNLHNDQQQLIATAIANYAY